MGDTQQNSSELEDAAAKGEVFDLLKVLKEGVPADVRKEALGLLPEAVEVAAKKGFVTQVTDVIGAEGVPVDVQIRVVDILAKNGRSQWLGGVIGLEGRDILVAVQAKIVDALAEDGGISAILDIIGAGNVLDVVQDRARLTVAKAIAAGGEEKIKEMTPEETIEAFGILTTIILKPRNPLQKDGVMSGGTVKKPASAKKDVKTGKKGLANKS